jgi:hypothetical protein
MKRQIINGNGKVTFEWDSKNIYDVIEFIRQRPAFSLGNSPKTINNLFLYLRAYQDALAQTGLLDYGIPDFSHFSTWTCGWRQKGALAAGWDYHILHKVRKNQEKAFNLFFDLIDEYKNSNIVASEVILTAKNIEKSKSSKTKRYRVAHFSDTGKENLLLAPHKIIIFQIGNSDSRWTVFYDKAGVPTYETFIDKSKEAVKQIENEFAIKKDQLIQLTNEEGWKLYKATYKDNADKFGMTVTSTQF